MILTKESIYNIITQENDIISHIWDRCYPSKAENNAEFPFIVYTAKESSIKNNYEKHTFDIDVFSKSEFDTNDLTMKLKNILSSPFWTVKASYIDSIKEEYSNEENVFKSTLTISLII